MKLTKTFVIGTALIATSALARELTFGMQYNETSNVYIGAQEFGKKLAEISSGQLTVKLFPSSTLGDFKAMVSQVQGGELDMVLTGYPDMSYVIQS